MLQRTARGAIGMGEVQAKWLVHPSRLARYTTSSISPSNDSVPPRSLSSTHRSDRTRQNPERDNQAEQSKPDTADRQMLAILPPTTTTPTATTIPSQLPA
ncbi:hypothetical protein K440DRAFT_616200 [Wilcoxina mikolae CBS 423.85]|nr:hypothetical protein K440DRAFT_616200 [Wilcoxina mikolae CBS 423.85]